MLLGHADLDLVSLKSRHGVVDDRDDIMKVTHAHSVLVLVIDPHVKFEAWMKPV